MVMNIIYNLGNHYPYLNHNVPVRPKLSPEISGQLPLPNFLPLSDNVRNPHKFLTNDPGQYLLVIITCVAFTLPRTSELVPLGLATPWQ